MRSNLMPFAVAVLVSAFALQPRADETMSPGEEHSNLAKRAGTFEVTGTAWNPATNAQVPVSGTARMRMILGGKFLQESFRGEWGGQSFTGLEITGFDRAARKYTSSWFDSVGTGTITMTGKAQSSPRQLVLRGRMFDPTVGKMTRVKSVTTVVSKDEFRRELFSDRSGTEKKTMELTYRRRK